MKALYQWLGKQVHAPYGTLLFSALVFVEGFLLMPVSTLLAFFSLENRQKALNYAFLASIISIGSALTGYSLGLLLWHMEGQTFLSYVVTPQTFNELVNKLTHHQAWSTFILALSPLPFNALTISSGFMGLPVIPFILVTLLARTVRFFIISGSIYLWGEQFYLYLSEYFYWVVGCFAIGYIIWKFVL